MREAASRGFFLASNAPFGYKRVKVNDGAKERPTLEIDPVTAPVVSEIFEKSLRGSGLKEICKELNERGITNRGKRWYKGTLHYVLRNEAYTGTAVWGKTSKGEKTQDPVRVEGAWARPGIEGAVRGRSAGDAGARTEGAEARESWEQVPAERAAQVRGVRQALLRPGSQERTVRLLHLRHPVPRGRGDVQRPLPERPQAGDVRCGEHG